MKKLFLTFSVICATGSLLKAQQNNYSLYSVSPLFTNPAGITLRQQRQVALSCRNIFIGTNDRMMLSSLRFSSPVKLQKKNAGAVDVNVFTERTGPNGIFQQTGILAGGAYDLRISPLQQLTFGLQTGVLFRGINENRIRTDSQYGSGGYDPDAPTGENISNWKTTAFTINTGLNWKYSEKRKPNDRREASPVAWAGVAFYNLNRANTSFYDDGKKMPLRTVLSGGYSFRRNRYEISPTARIMQEASSYQVNAGALIARNFTNLTSDIQKAGAGFWVSNARAAIFSLQVTHSRFFAAIGYDMPFQKGIKGNGMSGAMEIHLSAKI